jgi:hypothetical protein
MLFFPAEFSPLFYLDPGSGSILIQMVIATLLGGGIFVRSQWARIKKWFGKSEDIDENEDDGNADGR